MSMPISERTLWALRSSKPGMVLTIWVASRKEFEIGLYLLVDPGDRPVEGVDLIEMELEQEAVVSRQAASQRLAKLFLRCSDPPVCQAGQDSRIGLAGDHRLDHGSTADAQDVGDDRVDFDVAVFERLLQPQNVGGALANQLLAGAKQGPQLLGRTIRDKAATDQAVSGQLGEPDRIVHVGLAAGHVLHMRGVGQQQLELAIREDMPDRLPIDAGGFHGRERASLLRKPRREGQQAGRRGVERPHLLLDRLTLLNPNAGDHRLFVHVQSGAFWIENLHG